MIYNLQLLRSLAAFAVLCAHLILFGNSKYGLGMPQLENSAGFMMMGVDIFFIISGFIMVYTDPMAWAKPAGGRAICGRGDWYCVGHA